VNAATAGQEIIAKILHRVVVIVQKDVLMKVFALMVMIEETVNHIVIVRELVDIQDRVVKFRHHHTHVVDILLMIQLFVILMVHV
jgi:hypothetical protein